MAGMESELMLEKLYEEVGIEGSPEKLKQQILDNRTPIKKGVATNSNSNKATQPNSTQHNVPAWTVFAMFFMVVSLGNNVVREKVNESI